MTVISTSNRAVVPQAVLWIAAAAVCCGLLPARLADGQVPRTDDLKAYPIHNIRAAEIEQSLSRLLPPGSEVAADAQANQVWVRGSSQVHRIAAEIIGSLDKPAQQPPPPPVRQAAPPTLKSYPARPGEVAALAAHWNAQFGGREDVRIVADDRTSQVLVIAPPDVLAAIDRALGAGLPPRPASAPAPQYPTAGRIALTAATQPAPETPSRGFREVPLRQKTADQIGQNLAGMLGGRLSPSAPPVPGSTAFVLQLARGGSLTLTFDRQRQMVRIEGPQPAVASCAQLIEMLDASRQSADDVTRLLTIQNTRPADLRRAVDAVRTTNVGQTPGGDMTTARVANVGSLVSMLYQQAEPQSDAQPGAAEAPAEAQAPPAGQNGEAPARPGMVFEVTPEEGGGLIGPVQIEILEGLDTLVIRGHAQDVQKVIEMIKQIEELSKVTEPAIEVYFLHHANSEAAATMVQQLYTEVFAVRRGTVSITALVKPNALLLIGRPESVDTVANLIKEIDRPVPPQTQFRVFRLQHATAQTALTTIQGLYQEERAGLGTRVRLTADIRSNSLIVQAAPNDMAEVAAMIARIDTPTSDTVNELRLFQLNNTLAEELAQTLTEAIGGAAGTATGAGGGAAAGEQRSTTLRFVTVDTAGRQQLSSGILTDVKITADTRANTLLVSAPSDSMPLIAALIQQLDQQPAAEAEIKVFTIVNSDAASLMEMLETLFGEQAAAGEPAVQTAAVEEESSLVQLRFAVDERTNSIIASGTIGDLSVVEAILLRLDETDVRKRKSTVYRLKNAPAEDVAVAVNEYLTNERTVEQVTTELMSPFEQIEREVVVVAEPVSNSLIISATPEYYEEIMALVEKLDERPPMVMIQVLIAEVRLNGTDEFGVELGLQDSVLFDRSLLSGIETTTNSTQTNDAGAVTTFTEQIIRAATNTPGFLFNNQQLGNSGATNSLTGASTIGSQGLSNFDLGRINNDLGYGGLVLAASSNSVSVLLRALREKRRLEVLSRPQVMTMDNQSAFILVGERVPRVTGTQTNEAGQTNVIQLEDVGLILGVTPRISPDGLVVMEIDATNSSVGPEAEGIPISIAPNGDTIRSPRINTIQAQTTVSALDGQTVVLGGLITKSTNKVERRVPLLANVPVLGNLFKYDLKEDQRNELLIILTPHVVENEEDAELVKQMEVARIHWCLTDVLEMNGDGNLRGRADEWGNMETRVLYPDGSPADTVAPSLDDVPTPAAPAPKQAPLQLEPTPVPKDAGAAAPAEGDRKVEPAAYMSTADVPRPTPPTTVVR